MTEVATPRVTRLDGLRGVAVLLVFGAHLFVGAAFGKPFAPITTDWLQGGGVIGVQLFFVLSGYLITGVLLRDLERLRRVRFAHFYGRRARRLLPALAVVSATYAVYTFLWHRPGTENSSHEIVGALTYTYNFRLVNDWGYLGHVWSLCVEEQFYLTWPLVAFVSYRLGGRRAVAAVALVGIVTTVVLRSQLGISADKLYETMRWDALLVGCFLAVRPLHLPRIAGWIGAAVLLWYTLTLTTLPNSMYLISALAGGAVLVRAPHWKWLDSDVLRYFGRISYGLYLWSGLLVHFGWPGPVNLVVPIIAADLSYRFVEQRFWRPSNAPNPAIAELGAQ